MTWIQDLQVKISYLVPLISPKIQDVLCFMVAKSSVQQQGEADVCILGCRGSKGSAPEGHSLQLLLRAQLELLGSAQPSLGPCCCRIQKQAWKKQGAETKWVRRKLPFKNQVIQSNAVIQTWQLAAAFIHRPLKYSVKEGEVSTIRSPHTG